MNRSFMQRTLPLLIVIVLILALFAPGSVQPVHADCSWGDIICDLQQAVQQLVDQYVTPLKVWVQLQANKAFYSVQYGLARTAAGFMWSISRALTTVGVGVGVLSDWIATNFFQPMIQSTNDAMKPIVGTFLFLAFCILGLSYLLASLIRLNVVSFKSMVVWWLAGAIFFSIGPSLYLSLRQLHKTLSSLFYASSLSAVGTQNPFSSLAAGDPAAGNPVYAMSPLCSNFTAFLPGSAGNINGLDVALAFQKADGFDVVGGGTKCLGGGTSLDLPRQWIAENGFFDAARAPESWSSMVTCPPAPTKCDYDSLAQAAIGDMQLSVNQAFAGIAREWQAVPLVWFAIVEQIVAWCLIIAQGLTFLSFGCAMVFAFFRRTEPVAMSVIDQWLALLVQSVALSLVQGMCIALYLAAARAGSPLVSISVSVVMQVMMVVLLVSGLKAIWNAFNRLFGALGQASGGVFLSPGQVTVSLAGAAITGGTSLLTNAASVGGSLAGGAQALNNGATWAQAAGVTLGGSRALDGAALHLARLPGLRETALGEAASQYIEGASVRQVGKSLLGAVPGVGGALGRLGGASLGASLLTDRQPDRAEAAVDEQGRPYWQQPMLRRNTDTAMAALLAGPTWEAGQTSSIGRGGTTLTDADGTPYRKQDAAAEAVNPQGGWGRGEVFVALNNDGNLDETLDADFKRDLQADHQTPKADDGSAQRLTQAAQALRASADALQQPGRVEGRLNVSGANHIAAVMGRAVDALARDNAKTGQQGATSERVGAALAGVMGLSPVERDGKSVPPIDGRLNRFQMYADQALNLGMNGADAAQVLREVKANPEGRLLPATRDRLIHQQHDARGEAWADSVQHVQALEHSARLVPAALSAYGTRAMPPDAPLDTPVRFSPSGSSGAVIFTPTPAPTVIVSPTILTPTPTVIVTPTPAASTDSLPRADSALDGMRSEIGTPPNLSGNESQFSEEPA